MEFPLRRGHTHAVWYTPSFYAMAEYSSKHQSYWLNIVHIVYIEVNTRWNCIKLLVACDSCRSGTWFLDYFYKKVFKLIRATFSTSWIFGYSMKYAMLGAMCCTVCPVSLSLFSTHRKNWFAARCECLHLIKKNLQCLFACCEFFLIRCSF